ncbi:hypothetical protein RB195_026450 [Necator americanus]|uniref:Uncharacterized protein n=1 Tax=Necator americanus TaxID=51031 RepID=A0ABR1EX03_NECAM
MLIYHSLLVSTNFTAGPLRGSSASPLAYDVLRCGKPQFFDIACVVGGWRRPNIIFLKMFLERVQSLPQHFVHSLIGLVEEVF